MDLLAKNEIASVTDSFRGRVVMVVATVAVDAEAVRVLDPQVQSLRQRDEKLIKSWSELRT